MSGERLDKHSKIHHELFDEDTAQVGSLGDIVEKHAGDAVFLAPAEKSVGGADGGMSDYEAEMNEADPAAGEGFDPDDLYSAAGEGFDPDDLYSAADEDALSSTDQTGTVAGIARGFGTHLPQDFGSGGFQVEALPDAALALQRRPLREGEELDDYDDEDDANGQYDVSGDLARASEPGANPAPPSGGEPTPGRIPVKPAHPHTTDDELDATRQLK